MTTATACYCLRYCKWICAAAAAQGWRSVVLNYRGCNGLPLTSPRGYTALLSPDILIAVQSVQASARAATAGCSLLTSHDSCLSDVITFITLDCSVNDDQ